LRFKGQGRKALSIEGQGSMSGGVRIDERSDRRHAACKRTSKRHATFREDKPATLQIYTRRDGFTLRLFHLESESIPLRRFCLRSKIKTPGSNLSRLYVPLDRFQPGERQDMNAGVRCLIQCRRERVGQSSTPHPHALTCRSK